MIVYLVLLIIVVIACKKSIVIVPEGEEYVIERLGRFQCVAKPGMTFIVAFLDKVKKKVSLKETSMNFSKDIMTKDEKSVTIDALLIYQIIDSEKSVYNVNGLEKNLEYVFEHGTTEMCASMDANKLLGNKDDLENSVTDYVKSFSDNWGVQVNRVEIGSSITNN